MAKHYSKTGRPISKSRPASTRSDYIGIGVSKGSRRPASAKEWFESCNHKRNEEAWKQQDLEATVNFLKKRDWQTKIYNMLAEPKYMDNRTIDWKAEEKKQKLLNERRKKLALLFKEDEIQYERERQQREKEFLETTSSSHCHPEVEMLKSRLQELKLRNEEESRKIANKLSYEGWRKNSETIRQMESERLNRFVQEAWVDQKQWKEDERKHHEEERRKTEMEAAKKRVEDEEKERKRAEEKQAKLLEWRCQLDEQIMALREREQQEILLTVKERELEKERKSLEEIIHRRDRVTEARKRKELELFWARQYQLKLKKKAADIQEELLEDWKIIADLLRVQPEKTDMQEENQRIEEAKWMKHVLEEQKKLEAMREEGYDLLFSEEAEKMWHQREADWQREQMARDKLMQEVMNGLQKQINDRINSTQNDISQQRNEKASLISDIEKVQNLIESQALEPVSTVQNSSPFTKQTRSLIGSCSDKELRLEQQLRKQQIEEHRKEISRLEEEMRKLWEGSYVPPRYGRRKVQW